MMRAHLRINTNGQSETLAKILRSETEEDMARSNVNVAVEVDGIYIYIEAEDVVALRATLNSYLRWTKLAMDTNEAIGGIK
jgi:tRNA threonylcarbamoyladenosine modification (KEOPS) complex  Pcc1 subunit